MKTKRVKTGLAAFDKALGGGFVEPSISLVKGPPGIGKTTLLLHAMRHIHNHATSRARFVTSEEPVSTSRKHQLLGSAVVESDDVEEVKSMILLDETDIVVIDSLDAMNVAGNNIIHRVETIALDMTHFALKYGQYLFRRGRPVSLIFVCHEAPRKSRSLKNFEPFTSTILSIKYPLINRRRDTESGWKLVEVEKNRFGQLPASFKFRVQNDGIGIDVEKSK